MMLSQIEVGRLDGLPARRFEAAAGGGKSDSAFANRIIPGAA